MCNSLIVNNSKKTSCFIWKCGVFFVYLGINFETNETINFKRNSEFVSAVCKVL